MATTPTQVNISNDSEKAILLYGEKAQQLLLNQFSLRTNLEMIDRYYMREDDWTEEQVRNKIANRIGNKKKFQNVTVPVVMPQVESALAYLANVFVTGYPIFGVAGDPSTEDAALQMETIIAENSITAKWARQLLMFFRDGLKYNFCGLECTWQQRTLGAIDTDLNFPNNAKPKTQIWQGNVLRRLDPYNTFFDPRVSPADIHTEGEFAGYVELYSRVRMKKFINNLFGQVPVGTVNRAFSSSPAATTTSSVTPYTFYKPMINPYPIMANQNAQGVTFDWMSWATAAGSKNIKNGIHYADAYQVVTLYARILPSDFGLKVPAENTPQVWKFIIINGQVVLYAERLTNAHDYIPMFFGQPIEDGLDFQTKSFASNVMDMQDIASACWNGFIASKRRLVGDRVLFNPMMIRQKDIESTDPAAKIPVRPSAYGKPLAEAVYQFPYHDEATGTLVQAADAINRFADKINRQNPAQQGQFVKGNKTKMEYEDVMGHGNDGNQMLGIEIESQVFTPLKEVIKLNILQYQPEDTIYNANQQQNVKIDITTLRKQAVHFKVSDGMLPEEKDMSLDAWQAAMQALSTNPNLGAGYNTTTMFSYLMSLMGADLRPFEKSPLQQQYEQQVGQWQQAAAQAAKAGTPFNTPMPQMPPELIQELQQKQAGGQQAPTQEGKALESTQGSAPSNVKPAAQQQS